MAKKTRVLAICVIALAFFAIGSGVSPAGAAGKFRVAAVMPGTITDGSFNQSCYEGLKMIEKQLGAEIAFTEKVSQADQVENIVDYARRGYDLVIAHGGEMDAAAIKVAKKFPKVKLSPKRQQTLERPAKRPKASNVRYSVQRRCLL